MLSIKQLSIESEEGFQKELDDILKSINRYTKGYKNEYHPNPERLLLILKQNVFKDVENGLHENIFKMSMELHYQDIVKYLLSKYPQLKEKIPYHIGHVNLELVEWFIDYGFDVNTSTKEGDTSLHNVCCFRRNPDSILIMDLLIKNKANVNIQNNNGKYPIYNAAFQTLHSNNKTPVSIRIDMLKTLIDNNADINCRDNIGGTPLISATIEGDINLLKFLLKNKANVNITKSKQIPTCLHKALLSENLSLEYIEILLKSNADVGYQRLSTQHLHIASPFHYLFYNPYCLEIIEITKLLLKYDADINSLDKHQNSALTQLSNAAPEKKLLQNDLLIFIAPYLNAEIQSNSNTEFCKGDILHIINNPNHALLLAIQEKDSESIEYLARSNHDGRFYFTPEITEEIKKIKQDENSPNELLQALSLFNPKQKSAMKVVEYKDEPAEELFEEFIEALPGDSLDIMPQLQ
ncbi:MAG: hypothetical protein DGJ47_000537 [Rickettsiaceae bacterium]